MKTEILRVVRLRPDQPEVSLSLWHDAGSPNEAGRAITALPVCIVTGTALGLLSSMALSSGPARLFYSECASSSKAGAGMIMARVVQSRVRFQPKAGHTSGRPAPAVSLGPDQVRPVG